MASRGLASPSRLHRKLQTVVLSHGLCQLIGSRAERQTLSSLSLLEKALPAQAFGQQKELCERSCLLRLQLEISAISCERL